MRPIWMLMAGLLVASAVAQTAQPAAQPNEIHQLFIQDQRDRGECQGGVSCDNLKPLPAEQMTRNDAERRQRVHELLGQGALKTGGDFHDAAFIFQHGNEPNDYLLAHVLAMVAVAKGDSRGRWIAAATLDRYLHSMGEPQIFGTQYLTIGYQKYLQQKKAERAGDQSPCHAGPGEMCGPNTKPDTTTGAKNPAAIAVPAQLPANWNQFTQQPYNTTLIPDALRAEYCVATMQQQQKNNVEAINQKKGLSNRLVPGCAD